MPPRDTRGVRRVLRRHLRVSCAPPSSTRRGRSLGLFVAVVAPLREGGRVCEHRHPEHGMRISPVLCRGHDRRMGASRMKRTAYSTLAGAILAAAGLAGAAEASAKTY